MNKTGCLLLFENCVSFYYSYYVNRQSIFSTASNKGMQNTTATLSEKKSKTGYFLLV